MMSLIPDVIEAAFMPLEFGLGVRILTWFVAMYFVGMGGHLVFLAEHKLPLLGFLLGSFGMFVYFVIQQPEFLPRWITLDILLGTTLILLALIGHYMTYIVWQCYDLDPPWVRIKYLFFTELREWGIID